MIYETFRSKTRQCLLIDTTMHDGLQPRKGDILRMRGMNCLITSINFDDRLAQLRYDLPQGSLKLHTWKYELLN